MSDLNPNSPINRREFIKYSSAGAALGSSALLARAQAGANERISIGIIGAGARASAHINELLKFGDQHNVRITAICDVWQKNLESAVGRVRDKTGESPQKFTRFEELLALKDIDAVVIATPDFGHGAQLVAALKANKDVYIEKPMSIQLEPANEALELARAKKRVVQAGTQYRSDGRYRAATKVLATGVLGQVSRVSVAMNFNQARWIRDYRDCQETEVDWEAYLFNLSQRPFDPKLLRQWHLYKDSSNGLSGLWMSHYADLIHMLMNVAYPESVVAHGGTYVWKDGREHTDTFQALLAYPEGFLFNWGMSLGNAAGTHFTIHGTQGTMDLQNWTHFPEGSKDKSAEPTKIVAEPTVSHMENWLACLRTRERPNADIQFGHQHTVATIMAATALETGCRQKYDRKKRTIAAG